MRSGVKDRKPPYAEPLVRWCERSVNTKVGDKHLRLVFTSYSIILLKAKINVNRAGNLKEA